MKSFISIFISLLCLQISNAQQIHTFVFSKNDFLLDGKPFQMISGELHPARIPHEYWKQRIQMVKALGCNTISVYVFWNYHEISEGVFDFKTENRNIAEFIKICSDEKIWVIIRPGPYVCAEWDFGGMPPYLLKTPDIKVRCMDAIYMKAVERYISHLSNEIKTLREELINFAALIKQRITIAAFDDRIETKHRAKTELCLLTNWMRIHRHEHCRSIYTASAAFARSRYIPS